MCCWETSHKSNNAQYSIRVEMNVLHGIFNAKVQPSYQPPTQVFSITLLDWASFQTVWVCADSA